MTPTPPQAPRRGRLDNALRIEWRPIADLRPLGRKARYHGKRQLAAIKASIEQFGFVSPVLIDEQDRIVAGNARVEAARLAGLTDVPAVVVSHLTPDGLRAYVLADNRLAELGDWNKEVLQLELEELSLLDLDFSLEVTGFTLPEIEAIRFDVKSVDRDDALPEMKSATVARVGDIWRLGGHRLVVGNATAPEVLDQLLGRDQVRVVSRTRLTTFE